ncbi:DUF4198 domain-containing protein [Croceiramulus getboli]|nr:DUF4198 domain-containing protein [Flavobacteriaceae bacterium YJPT1-3]
MYLKLNQYFLDPESESIIALYNGTFDQSENVIARDRMLDVSLVGEGQRFSVDSTQWYEENAITYLRFKSGKSGTWVAGVSTAPRNIALDANAFNKYLEHDGVLDLLAERKQQNLMEEDAVERYSKHVKTIFQVGEQRTDSWNTILDYPIEFVPQENPYDLHPGHALKVQLLYDGKPLENQLVYVGHDPKVDQHEHEHAHGETTHTHEDTSSRQAGEDEHTHDELSSLRTDEEGIVTVDIQTAGVYYLRTIHMTALEDQELTHESNWATLTFAVGSGHSHEHSESSHSHEEDGIPSYVFWVGSLLLIGVLFFFFRKK